MKGAKKLRDLKKSLLIVLSTFLGLQVNAQVFDMVVAADGSGDYTSIQAALDAVPTGQSTRTLIYVKAGMYREKVTTSSTLKNVSIIGEDADNVILSWNDYYPNISAADSYTFLADIAGLYVENLTIENTAKKEFGSGVGQALAVRTIGDSMAFKNCKYLSFQDTYYAHKNRNYNLNCYVEGGTDFIYGDATSVWDSCTINCLPNGYYITAPADAKIITPTTPEFLHGLLFRYCNITAADGVPNNQYYLGRPWAERSSSVFIECTLGPHIRPIGWDTWGNDETTTVFAEYKSKNPDGSLTDVSQRASWSYQLDSSIVARRYNLAFFLRRFRLPNQDTWDPTRVTTPASRPTGFKRTGSTLVWQNVENAIGYVILKDGSTLGFSETESFEIPGTVDENAEYTAKSVSFSGALSQASTDVVVSNNNIKEENLQMVVLTSEIQFSEIVNFQVYSMQGKLLTSGRNNTVSIQELGKGIFVVQASEKGKFVTQKIRIQ